MGVHVLRSFQWPILCHVIVDNFLHFYLTSHDPWQTLYIFGNVILTLMTTVIHGHTNHREVVILLQPDAVTGADLTYWCWVMVPSKAGL